MSKAIKRRDVKPAPKQERARKRQTAILAAAEALLLDGSPTDISTTSVAVKAGIPVGSIYRYFEDKEDILEQLYQTAYNEVEQALTSKQAETSPDASTGTSVGDAIRGMLDAFWKAARSHKTFVPLTRWANSHYSLWDVTPGQNSSLATLIENTLVKAGVQIPDARRDSAQKTLVTTVSVLIDVIIEEDDAARAKAQIEELAILLEAYVSTFG